MEFVGGGTSSGQCPPGNAGKPVIFIEMMGFPGKAGKKSFPTCRNTPNTRFQGKKDQQRWLNRNTGIK